MNVNPLLKVFFDLLYKNRSNFFYKSNLSFYPLQKQIQFLPYTKTDLIFTNQILFF